MIIYDTDVGCVIDQ
jgi:hypothetical protein